MAQGLVREAGIRILNEVVLNQVAVRFGSDDPSDDSLTSVVTARVQEDGICFAAEAQWKGLWIMRLSIISWATTEEDAHRPVATIISAWRAVQAEAA